MLVSDVLLLHIYRQGCRQCYLDRNEKWALKPVISSRLRARAWPPALAVTQTSRPQGAGKNRPFATGGTCSHNWRPGCRSVRGPLAAVNHTVNAYAAPLRSEEHTSELQS